MARIERRLVPIVSLDVEGYSRLTQLNEATTLAAVHHVFKDVVETTIGEHGGSVAIVNVKPRGARVEIALPFMSGRSIAIASPPDRTD